MQTWIGVGMADLWFRANLHFANVIANIAEDQLAARCYIGDSAPVSLQTLLANYVDAAAERIRRIT